MEFILTEPGFTYRCTILSELMSFDMVRESALAALRITLRHTPEEEIINRLTVERVGRVFDVSITDMSLASAKIFKDNFTSFLDENEPITH